jgi:hypothetical protein
MSSTKCEIFRKIQIRFLVKQLLNRKKIITTINKSKKFIKQKAGLSEEFRLPQCDLLTFAYVSNIPLK